MKYFYLGTLCSFQSVGRRDDVDSGYNRVSLVGIKLLLVP